ncbi:uncharacterized protein LOC126678228 [Mercurialis annua]|uniref:uncharacterized protein LOC126678228 n=1 Tax=Mercurialis annua TaxID=3986 RepID=UPI00215E499D|nr:uncharacterized protein LOC126678228 [Mercurialis annua]
MTMYNIPFEELYHNLLCGRFQRKLVKVYAQYTAIQASARTFSRGPHQFREKQQQQAPQRSTLGEFFLPDVDHANFGCFAPPIQANTFEIKTSTIILLENRCQFYGLPIKDPNAHILKFLEVCNTFKIPNMTEDQIKLRLFPFSLRDKVRPWIRSIASNSITIWRQLAEAFLNKYFPLGKTARLTKKIIDFFQHDGEALYEAWDKLNELQRSCPHHHLQKEQLIQIFYNGINEHTRATIDAASGCSIMRKKYKEALALLDELAMYSSSWPIERVRQSTQRGMITLEQIQELEAMKAKNVALQAQVEMYKRQASQMNAPVAAVQAVTGHATNDQVNYVGGQRQGNDPYSNTYNPRWENHPNFAWKDTNHVGQANANTQSSAGSSNFQLGNHYQPNQGNFNSHNYGGRPQYPSEFQQNRDQDEESKLDKILEKMEGFERFEAEARQIDKTQASAFHHLEVKLSQLESSIQGRTQGGLPYTAETNPREFVKAITPRSGKFFDDPHSKKPIKVNDESSANEASSSKSGVSEEVVVGVEAPYVRPPPPSPYVPKVPFPSRLKKKQDNQKCHKFLDIFRKLQINISLVDVLREMPQYAKFIKDIIMNKRSWDEKGTISLTENCSSIITSKLPTKLQDPGSFTISCSIGTSTSLNCLFDLGASINLMPLCLFRNLCGNQSVKEISMMLQLADHSLIHLRNRME